MNALSAFECVAIQEENAKLRAELDALKADRRVLQAKGKYGAPCARFCESNAYEIAERGYKAQIEKLIAERDALLKERADTLAQEPFGYIAASDMIIDAQGYATLIPSRNGDTTAEGFDRPLYSKPFLPSMIAASQKS